MIILGPDLTCAWARAGKLTPLQSSPSSKLHSSIIGVTLSFPNVSNRPKDRYHHKAKVSIKLFLCSIYHPHEHAEQTEFYDELESFISSRPRKLELLIGEDVNCNLGFHMPMFRDMIGKHVIYNRNNKVKDLIYLINSFNLKILLTYFEHANYVMYRTFSATHSPHTMDNFICCDKFFKRVNDCKTTTSGVRSDHSAIHIKFKLTAIKLDLKRDALTIIDWGDNCTDTKTNTEFNTRLHLSLM